MEEQVWAIVEGRSLGESQLLPSLRQWLDFKITGVLPREGGTLDQDPVFMAELRLIDQWYNKFTEYGRQVKEAQAEVKRRVGR